MGTIGDHEDAIASLKDWIQLRIPWITSHLGAHSACDNVATPPLVLTRINYHPEESDAFPEEEKLEFLEITNAGTFDVDLTGIYFSGTGLVYQFPAGAHLPAGSAVALASDSMTYRIKNGKAPMDSLHETFPIAIRISSSLMLLAMKSIMSTIMIRILGRMQMATACSFNSSMIRLTIVLLQAGWLLTITL